MKNITITVDDETYRQARIRAAEQGTSVSAMVKRFLNDEAEQSAEGVPEMPMSWTAKPSAGAATSEPLPPGAYGRFADGTPYYTKDGQPRQPGAMRGMLGWTEDFDSWPDGFLDALYGNDTPASQTWWLSANDVLKPSNG